MGASFYHTGMRTWAPLGHYPVWHSSANSVHCVGKPSLGRFGWQQAWGQHAGVVRPVGYVCVTAAEKTRKCAGLSGEVTHPPPAGSGGSSITFLLSPSDKVLGQLKAHARDGGNQSQEKGEVDLVTEGRREHSVHVSRSPRTCLCRTPSPWEARFHAKPGPSGQCHVPGRLSRSPCIPGTGEASSLSLGQLCSRT